MSNENKNEFLNVSVEGENIVIRLPFGALQHAVEVCPDLEEVDDEGDFAPPIVTDISKFAADVVKELQREEEDGTTPVHRMFDAAFVSAVDGGSDGIEIYGFDGYEKAKSGRLKNGIGTSEGNI